jgi:MFS family permease
MRDFASLAVLSAALFATTYAVNLQAPLYSAYAANSHVGATAITIAFAAYVAGLMPTLILLGGMSDRIGRRVPIALALVLGVAGTAFLVLTPTWPVLVLARLLLGISTGFATTAGTAYMAELFSADRTRHSTLLVTSATSLGFGGGALATGLSLSAQGPSFMPASYVAFFCVAPLLALAVLLLPRADAPKKVAMLRLPVFPPGTWRFGVALAIAWSATGMTIAVVPLQLEMQGLGVYTGIVIFLAVFVGFLSQPLARRLSNHAALSVGFALVPLGFLTLDPPPLNWSILKYVFWQSGGPNAEETPQARRDRRQAAPGRRPGFAGAIRSRCCPRDRRHGGDLLSMAPGVRRSEVRSGETVEGSGGGERASASCCFRSHA